MSRNIFGWSLPPGCGSLPGESGGDYCEVCYKQIDDCICPECPECGECGDPHCYRNNHLTLNEQQQQSVSEFEKSWAEERKAEDEAAALYKQDLLEDY